jgi:hypothetical protein
MKIQKCPKCNKDMKYDYSGKLREGDYIINYAYYSCNEPDCEVSMKTETNRIFVDS